MSTRTWSRTEIIAYAALHGVKLDTDEDVDRFLALATRVATVAAAVKRMPSKGDEPASVFRVPL